MNPKTITVAYIAMKPTTTGKQRWNVKDTDENWYSVWDTHVADAIKAGDTLTVTIETKGDFSNIKAVVPDGMKSELSSFMDVPETRAAFDVDPPAAPKPTKLTTELDLIVNERIAAFTVASQLASSGKIEVRDMEAFADKALTYYRKSPDLMRLPEQKSSSTEEFLT